MRLAVFSILLALTPAAAPRYSGPASPPEPMMLVSTSWLAEHLNDPDLVIIEIGPRESYDAGHIPGARFVDFHGLMAPHDSLALSLELPSAARLDSTLGALGVAANSRIVVYFSRNWITPATRVYLTLEYAGLGPRTSLLDGGLKAWQAEKRPVSLDTPQVRPTAFHADLHPEVVVGLSWLTSHLNDPSVRIVDARLSRFYTDSVDNEMPRGGHIPGARNIPYVDLVDTTSLKLRSRAELAGIFAAAGVGAGDTVVSYCHIGQQGTLAYFTARYLGYAAQLYDGSFEEWSAHAELPVAGAQRAPRANQ